MIRVVLIDDHALVRAGFRMILEREDDIEIAGQASDGEEGIALLRTLQPDVALLDVHMPGLSGIEVTERARKAGWPTRIVILTVLSESPFPRRLLEAGACGYLTKACVASELVHAVRLAAEGRRYLAPDVAQQLVFDVLDGGTVSPFEALTSRELEIAIQFARGADARTIATRLHISEKTVATHKARTYAKLNIDNEVALAHLAQLHGVLNLATTPLRSTTKRRRANAVSA